MSNVGTGGRAGHGCTAERAGRAGRALSELDIQAGGRLRITDDVDETVAKLKPAMAFQLGQALDLVDPD